MRLPVASHSLPVIFEAAASVGWLLFAFAAAAVLVQVTLALAVFATGSGKPKKAWRRYAARDYLLGAIISLIPGGVGMVVGLALLVSGWCQDEACPSRAEATEQALVALGASAFALALWFWLLWVIYPRSAATRRLS